VAVSGHADTPATGQISHSRISYPIHHSSGRERLLSIAVAARTAKARLTRWMRQRCSAIGSRCGARARNAPSRSRGSRLMNGRSWVGLTTPRVAANASASSRTTTLPRTAAALTQLKQTLADLADPAPRITCPRRKHLEPADLAASHP